MRPEEVIRRPLILTEKGERLRAEQNKYFFEVDPRATKRDVAYAVETLFKVDVVAVHTMNVRGKLRRMGRGWAKMRNWKKAIVTLAEGDAIDFFEGA